MKQQKNPAIDIETDPDNGWSEILGTQDPPPTNNRPLPWHVIPPYRGCNGKTLNYSVWDNDGNLVCECHGKKRGKLEAKLIVTTANTILKPPTQQ